MGCPAKPVFLSMLFGGREIFDYVDHGTVAPLLFTCIVSKPYAKLNCLRSVG